MRYDASTAELAEDYASVPALEVSKDYFKLKSFLLSLQKLMSEVDRNDMLVKFFDTTVALYDFVASSINMLKVVRFLMWCAIFLPS
jgi:hypothetical protein